MRRIAVINQKGGVGKTTTSVNLGAALARAGRRVVLVDLDPQANLSMHLDVQLRAEEPSVYGLLLGDLAFKQVLRETSTPNMLLVASSLDLSGAELELANAFGRELLLREALDVWEREHREATGAAPADYVLLDCPPSLGLLSINGLVAAHEAVIALQTEFFALQGMSRLVDVVQLLRRRLNPRLEITGILPCLYDNRLKLAREVLAEIRAYFPGQVYRRAIAKNVKLAEAPSYGKTIFEYAPDSPGALDYTLVAAEMMSQETRDPDLAPLARPAPDELPEPASRAIEHGAKNSHAPSLESRAVGSQRDASVELRESSAGLGERERAAARAIAPRSDASRVDVASAPFAASSEARADEHEHARRVEAPAMPDCAHEPAVRDGQAAPVEARVAQLEPTTTPAQDSSAPRDALKAPSPQPAPEREPKVVLVPQPPQRLPQRIPSMRLTPDDLLLGATPALEDLPSLPDDALEIPS